MVETKEIGMKIDERKEKFILGGLNECKISEKIDKAQRKELEKVLYENNKAFATEEEPFGAIIGHDVRIKLTIEKPYPPILRRPAYPASPRSREALKEHIEELTKK